MSINGNMGNATYSIPLDQCYANVSAAAWDCCNAAGGFLNYYTGYCSRQPHANTYSQFSDLYEGCGRGLRYSGGNFSNLAYGCHGNAATGAGFESSKPVVLSAVLAWLLAAFIMSAV
ncbi:hypothetical protein BD324DRAFT_648082 [Kockovaella imperatae]|uniref:Uncharacterized protein n=1 Tax=Kockovaella imperatae TaxID=4999 RepID=A0A1Y1UUP9_9TREE|nr:hypothetical protein BD324DRAFT_648082 [Kockovaella imperatae]ORX41196.1 hypothetical protein BD324DRAFT_648082 [Kockovaella imperatae]